MKIIAASDLHGNLIDIPEADLLLLGGDLLPLSIQEYTTASRKWFQNKFIKWANHLPVDKVLFIGGNHDKYLYEKNDLYFKDTMNLFGKDDKVTYLEDELYDYKGITIYGTPWCKIFGHWSFMKDDSELRTLYNKIPKNLDILLSHDAPFGVSDVLLQEDCTWADGSHIGNVPLAEAVTDKQPKYNFHGHLHSTNHEGELLGKTKVYNTSIKNENYKIVYDPLIIKV